MAVANTIVKANHVEGLTTCRAMGRAVLNATGAIAALGTLDIEISDQKIRSLDLGFAAIQASPDADLSISKVVCSLGKLTVTVTNHHGTVASTDGALTINYFVLAV